MKKFLKDVGVVLLIILTIFATVYIIIISADAEYEAGLEKERNYQEYIQREARWKKQYNLMRNVDSASTMKF